MKTRILAGVACAALTILSAPVTAATPEFAPAASVGSIDQAVNSFYASRGGAPLWLRPGADSGGVNALMSILQRGSLDGMPSGPSLALEAQTLIGRANLGDPAALRSADRLLSTAWVLYVQALQTPPSGIIYADSWVMPRRETPLQILGAAAGATSLAAHVREVSQVNPIYSKLRETAWEQMQATGQTEADPRVLTSLERVREMPFQKRYVMVDTAGARLYMIDNNRVVDSMRVVVGKADPSTQTPMLASTIYYATLNPYWHVTPELVRSLIAHNVLTQGLSYLKTHGYQVMPADPSDDRLLDPANVDWHAVAAGKELVRVRQLPGPANSMGHLKFGFPNADDIYLHDTPVKNVFAQDDRNLSHGCIRLEDAERLGRFLMGHDPETASNEPEQHELLPTPVPIYVTYMTAQADGGQLSFVDDVYRRDAQHGSQVATSAN